MQGTRIGPTSEIRPGERASERAKIMATSAQPTVNNTTTTTLPTQSKSSTTSPRAIVDDSIASIFATSSGTSTPHGHSPHQSTDDTPLIVRPAAPRPRLRDRGKSTHASFRPSSTSTKNLQPLPSHLEIDLRSKTSPPPTASPRDPPTSPPLISLPGTPLPISHRRRASTTIEQLRSPPLNKRPPAWNSCHGVETSSGPPPALSLRPPLVTANTTGAIEAWRKATTPAWPSEPSEEEVALAEERDSGAAQRLTPSALARLEAAETKKAESTSDRVRAPSRGRKPERTNSGTTISVDEATKAKAKADANRASGGSQVSTPRPMRVDSKMAGNGPHRTSDEQAGDNTQGSRRSQSSGEDLFLNLARADVGEEGSADNGAARRRVRTD